MLYYGIQSASCVNQPELCGGNKEQGRCTMKLYHTSTVEIRHPDLRRGRKNADFGQGFYLTPDREFASRWARENAVVNEYELDEEGLSIRRFRREEDWFRCIYLNRRRQDCLSADLIIGPIANDTIFETLGIIDSGFLSPGNAMKLLLIGPEYTQVAVKSEKALAQLRWIRSERIEEYDPTQHRAEQEAYQTRLAEVIGEIMDRDGEA